MLNYLQTGQTPDAQGLHNNCALTGVTALNNVQEGSAVQQARETYVVKHAGYPSIAQFGGRQL